MTTEPDEEPRGDGPADRLTPTIDALTFDDAFAELQRTVAELEAGGLAARGDDRAVRARASRSSAAASGCSARPSSASSSSWRAGRRRSRPATSAPRTRPRTDASLAA